MKSKELLFSVIILFINQVSFCQSADCLDDFDFLVKKIQADYPGYNDKVTNANRAQLAELEKDIREKIKSYPDSCIYYFNRYARFFKDHHLGVHRIQTPSTGNISKPGIMDVSTYGKNVQVNTDSLQQATATSKGIEGVWEGYREKFAIIKDGQKYIGVAIKTDGWKEGQVMYEFQPVNDTVFNTLNYSLVNGRKAYTTKTSIHLNGKIIEFHDYTRFVRKTGSDILDKATLNAYVPQFPNGRNTYSVAAFLSDSTFYLRISSFANNTAKEFVTKYWNEITTRPNPIIDIRGNGGGLDEYYLPLTKLIYSRPYELKGMEWYASKGNIQIMEDDIKQGKVRPGLEKWAKDLVEAMKKNVGGFVTDPSAQKAIIRKDTVYPLPRNIGIIINDANASSAEQFLIDSKESSNKVILFGNCNTAGVLDYSCVGPAAFPSNRYELHYPFARSKRLPENPIDNIGISPDVMIPFPDAEQLFDKLDTWVYFVKNYLEILDERNRK